MAGSPTIATKASHRACAFPGMDPCCRNATLQPAMAGTEAFSRAKIDAQLTDVGWNLTDGRSVHFEYTLEDGTRADYVLANRQGRPMAVVEAKKASINAVEAEG